MRRRATTQAPSEEAAPPPPVRERRGGIKLAADEAQDQEAAIKNMAEVRAIYSQARSKKAKAGIQKLNLKQAFQLVKDGSRAIVLSKGIASLLSVAKEKRQQEENAADLTWDFEQEVEHIKMNMAAGEHFDDMKTSLISIVTKAFEAEDEGVASQFKDAMVQVSESLSSLKAKLSMAQKDNDDILAFLASIQDSFATIGVNVQNLMTNMHKANVALGQESRSPKPQQQAGSSTPEDSISDSSSSSDAPALGEEEAEVKDPERAGGSSSGPEEKKDIVKTITHSRLLSHSSIFSESQKRSSDHMTKSLMNILGEIVQQQVTEEIQETVIGADIDDLVEIMANRWHTAKRKLRMASWMKVSGKKPGLSALVAASKAAVAPTDDRPLTDRPFSRAPPAGWTEGHKGHQFDCDHAERQIRIFAQTMGPRIDRWTEVKKQAVSARGAGGIETVMVDRSQRKGLIRGLGLRPLGVQRPPFPTTQTWESQGDSTLLKVLSRHTSRFEHDGIQLMATDAGKTSLGELTAYSLTHSALGHLDVPARQRWAKLPQLPGSRLAAAVYPDDLVEE